MFFRVLSYITGKLIVIPRHTYSNSKCIKNHILYTSHKKQSSSIVLKDNCAEALKDNDKVFEVKIITDEKTRRRITNCAAITLDWTSVFSNTSRMMVVAIVSLLISFSSVFIGKISAIRTVANYDYSARKGKKMGTIQ